ncbi:DNA-3-methyladenine glycosylase I [Acetilactobacillus jinshanensis]|uniref:DNA-3-methyladenine glycosylase I n=1 Tax=Acetilactobacillus jinshanensis TaxID=1720083 RepID=A0A4P6ZLL5_9LACO|nr:DNA-3-methyladenine glycosylase I [Acetilactobacillus jinshanensis]
MINIKNLERCSWANRDPLLQQYHDQEWGVPEYNEQQLFALLSLEIFQAGLQWKLILQKRDAIYQAFDNFDYSKVARYSGADLKRLLNNKKIIRNRLKIKAIISNAKRLVKLHHAGITLRHLTWSPVNNTPLDHLIVNNNEPLDYSKFIEPFLIKFRYYQFKRIGPKTLYSYLQAVGVVNDHLTKCFRHSQIS